MQTKEKKAVYVYYRDGEIVIAIYALQGAVTLRYVKQDATRPKTFEKRWDNDNGNMWTPRQFAEAIRDVKDVELFMKSPTKTVTGGVWGGVAAFISECDTPQELWSHIEKAYQYPVWVKDKISNPFLVRNHRNYATVQFIAGASKATESYEPEITLSPEERESENKLKAEFYAADADWGVF
ncbi:hypothetical protein [Asticcacaulis sp. AND118]|uniref:hypothetical protein n=1 Tax=Asticcacaulis sp. AND118 TaxID=2840468 RepID=UPI001CFFF300|nr:hypothetical protein [Asticcacaulis sp. AND118]UDF05078.1 hypothetical protein LH365_16945 [Asticcacaulis sp. AND118]